MAYTITRKNRLKEELQLCHADGSLALTATVDINIDEIGQRISKAYEMLGMAQNELEKAPTSVEAMTAYGDAVIAVFTVIFGEEDTDAILRFYENNYSEMLLDIFPFINDEILPKVRDASEARKNQLLDLANKSKGKRGFFGK